jgi:ketosteroid isomerase-like protein
LILGIVDPGLCLPGVSAQNVELLREIYERWARGDFAPEPSFSEEMTLALGPDFPDSGEHTGPEGIAAYMKGFLEPWDRLTITAEQLIDSENRVLVRVLQSGTGASSGVAVELRYFHLWTFDGARPVLMESIMEEADARARLERA